MFLSQLVRRWHRVPWKNDQQRCWVHCMDRIFRRSNERLTTKLGVGPVTITKGLADGPVLRSHVQRCPMSFLAGSSGQVPNACLPTLSGCCQRLTSRLSTPTCSQFRNRRSRRRSLYCSRSALGLTALHVVLSYGAEGGIRTPTVLPPPAPQAGASASSATSAISGRWISTRG
jgi:hypothetical protein